MPHVRTAATVLPIRTTETANVDKNIPDRRPYVAPKVQTPSEPDYLPEGKAFPGPYEQGTVAAPS